MMSDKPLKNMMRSILSAAAAAVLIASAGSAAAWGLWDDFKTANVENARVVDYSDNRRITTSEGQSYALFFALVANDRTAFAALLDWTEKNLSGGDLAKTLPSWLWGQTGSGWGVIDTNNAADSDMWIAWCLLEAGRLWNEPAYREKGLAMMALLRKEVRDVRNLGRVILPGRVGFEDKDGSVKLNPSYYPLFILKRFALEDAWWNSVYDGSFAMLVRSSPSGFAPEWAKFAPDGRYVVPDGTDYHEGSYNAIRTYLWAGMMSPEDPARPVLVRHFAPMVEATRAMNFPPEKTEVVTGDAGEPGPDYFGACVLPLLGDDRTAGLIRTVLTREGVRKDRYYGNVLMLYGLGFDEGRWAFDAHGRLVVRMEEAQK